MNQILQLSMECVAQFLAIEEIQEQGWCVFRCVSDGASKQGSSGCAEVLFVWVLGRFK